jgi:hypothetical protein
VTSLNLTKRGAAYLIVADQAPGMELDISYYKQVSVTYDHRLQKAGDPVRSPLHKLQIGRFSVSNE